MPAPSTSEEYLELVRKSDLLATGRIDEYVKRRIEGQSLPPEPLKLAQAMIIDGLLTKYQAEQLLMGRWRNFILAGKYKLLERLGQGGMALVFLCEHQVMKRLVAVKILPTGHAEDRELLGRFHREARALSQLRHPNIVGAYDVDNANKIHFLVMEFVEGGDLDQIVRRVGPLSFGRAAHYIRQAACGLQHAHEAGLVHRDIKPGNLLVDRAGTVKLLDLGLARIFHESTDDLTTGRDARTLLGTVDYLAPEQALNSHDVDIRADIYALGATFYFLLAGKGLFEDGTVAQKLSWHMHRPPSPIGEIRSDVPDGLLGVLETMLAKRPEDRYQEPHEVIEALEPWTREPIAPPTDAELPRLSRAARNSGPPSSFQRGTSPSALTSFGGANWSPGTPSKKTLIMPSEVPTGSTPPSSRPPDTLPDATKIKPPPPAGGALPKRAARAARSGPSRRRKTAVTALSTLVALGAVGAAASWSWFGPSDAGSGRGAGLGKGGPGPRPVKPTVRNVAPPVDQPADATVALVPASGPSRSFATLREAIAAAGPGDRVEVRGNLIREAVELSATDNPTRGLTLVGIAPNGGAVRWSGPADLGPGKSLLDASGVEALKLRGFLFDGEGKVGELICLSGRGGGSALEDLQVRGAARAGVVLRGWSGDPDRPATLRGVRFATDGDAEAAIRIESDPGRPDDPTRDVRVASCRFVGRFQAALLVVGPVAGLDVEHCRFSQALDGLRYRRGDPRRPIRARLANNTFADVQRGLHFETTPPALASELVVANNLFVNTNRIATLANVSVQPAKVSGRWIWTEEGKRSPSVPAGDRFFRKAFDVAGIPAQATLDIGCDETFTVYINGLEVARGPSDHFTQRVFRFDIAGRLRPGKNVVAVKGTNQLDRIDPRYGTTAGLLAQVIARQDGREIVLARSDETWKSESEAPEAWTRPDFDDGDWKPARPWPEAGATWPWIHAVWDAAVLPQLKPPLEPIRPSAAGNVRDYKSWEGYPALDAERVVLADNALARDPEDDAKFLRLPRSHPLYQAGPGGSPIGVYDGD